MPQVMNLYFMSELTTVTVSRKGQALLPLKWRKTFGLESGGPCDARELNDGKGSLLLIPRPKARRGTKGLLAHLREQTVSFPRVRRHRLPSK
jgi:bifunctional DNA-binding transcriptional regulator/antitoxin component of YhaV-PrlF toxin-antitoxin module